MHKLITCLLAIFFLSACLEGAEILPIRHKKRHKPTQQNVKPPIYGALPAHNMRYATFDLAFQLMGQRRARVIVETGSARQGVSGCCSEGCSTYLFAQWAKSHNATLYSVDINPEAIDHAKNATDPVNPEVAFYNMDSVLFLEQFDQVIDFLYLDSYDFDSNNPLPSQEHHLKEIIAAYPHLRDHSVIMIDDCNLPYGGKGKLVIEWLQQKGWLLLASAYQSILIKSP
jgi:hypothetical protein